MTAAFFAGAAFFTAFLAVAIGYFPVKTTNRGPEQAMCLFSLRNTSSSIKNDFIQLLFMFSYAVDFVDFIERHFSHIRSLPWRWGFG